MVWAVAKIHGDLRLRIHGLSSITDHEKAALAAFFMPSFLIFFNFVHKSVYKLLKSCHLAVKY